MAHKWARWLHHPCHLGGSPPLQSEGQNQNWPTSGQRGYIPPAVWGLPTASERGAKSEVAHKWARWLHNPCRLGDPHRFRAGGKIGSGPQVGKVATSPLPPGGSPPLQSGGQNQKWPTSGQGGYITPAASGDPHRFKAGGKIRSGPQVGKVATSPLPPGGSPPLQSGGQNEKWPTSGQGGYITPAASGDPHRFKAEGKIGSGPQVGKVATSPLPPRGIPTASERGAKSELAHKWARWLHPPCRLGAPHRFRAGGKIRSGPQVGKVATSPLPPRASPPLQSEGQNQKWPTSGQGGYIAPTAWGILTASKWGAKSQMAHKWARWLHSPYRVGDPHRFRAGGKIRSGPQVGRVAASPLPRGGSPPL